MMSSRLWGGALSVAKANVASLSVPLKLNLCLTYACQYRCQTCNIWRRKPTNELTTSELIRFITTNRDTRWLDLTGGEIFLRKDVHDVLETILSTWKRLVVLHFPTNGFLTREIVAAGERLARESSLTTIITVSLDGDERVNDQVRGIKGGFARQIETFKALRKIAGLQVVLGMTVSRLNAGLFAQTFEACRREIPDLREEEFHLNVAQTSEHYYGNDGLQVAPPGERLAADLAAHRAHLPPPYTIAGLVERVFLQRMQSFLATGRTPIPCHALRSSCFIDPHGIVYPCITYSRPLGRLRDTNMDLEPIWARAETRQVQEEIWSGKCPQCWTACEAYQSILGNVVRPQVFWR